MDGTLLLSGSEDQSARVWHVHSRQCLRVVNHKGTLRPWQTRTHCCGHIGSDTNVSPFARARNICCGHKKCFWFCSETFCVRNKCFPVCAAWKHNIHFVSHTTTVKIENAALFLPSTLISSRKRNFSKTLSASNSGNLKTPAFRVRVVFARTENSLNWKRSFSKTMASSQTQMQNDRWFCVF